jgi:hypothetical protein
MKRTILLALGACCTLTLNAKAITADEAAMAALYPAHETFFEHELHPVADSRVAPAPKFSITSIELILIEHISCASGSK